MSRVARRLTPRKWTRPKKSPANYLRTIQTSAQLFIRFATLPFKPPSTTFFYCVWSKMNSCLFEVIELKSQNDLEFRIRSWGFCSIESKKFVIRKKWKAQIKEGFEFVGFQIFKIWKMVCWWNVSFGFFDRKIWKMFGDEMLVFNLLMLPFFFNLEWKLVKVTLDFSFVCFL